MTVAIVIQNDNGTMADANSYCDVTYFKAYHAARGKSWGSSTDDQIAGALVQSTDFVDGRFTFRGRATNLGQTTRWPRIAAYDNDRRILSGIPRALKEAVCAYALRALTATLNPDPVRDATGQTVISKSSAVGPITKSVTYAPGGVLTMPKYPEADNKLRSAGLVETTGTVQRG